MTSVSTHETDRERSILEYILHKNSTEEEYYSSELTGNWYEGGQEREMEPLSRRFNWKSLFETFSPEHTGLAPRCLPISKECSIFKEIY